MLRRKRAVVKKAKRVVLEPLPENEDYSDVAGDPGGEFALENKKSDRAYTWAHDSRDSISELQRGAVPYGIEHYEGDDVEDALRPRGAKGFMQKGDRITVRDHVLMSCDRARLEKRKRYLIKHNRAVWDGRAAQADADEVVDKDRDYAPSETAMRLRSNQPIATYTEE
jgi:hypothetical protein